MTDISYVIYGDLKFPRLNQSADYDSTWSSNFNDRTLINVTQCWESSIIFAARNGWVDSTAPICNKEECSTKNTSSYCTQRGKSGKWVWRFRCCKRRLTILANSIFSQSRLTPGQLLEILWKISSRTPSSMIPLLIFGKPKSEVYVRIRFFRDVAG